MTAKKTNTAKTLSPMTVLAQYFKLPGQSVADIAAELKALTAAERKELANEIVANG